MFAKLTPAQFRWALPGPITLIQCIVSAMIPTTNASAAIHAVVHQKSSVFTLIVINSKRRCNIDAAASRTRVT